MSRPDQASARPRLRPLRVAALAVAAIVAGAAGPPPLPALVVPPGNEHHPGKMVFAELVTPDLAAAKQFYGALFGWTFQDSEAGASLFTEATASGRTVAGLVQRPLMAGRRPAWLSFMATTDVDREEALAVQHGGKVLLAPHSIATLGREVVLADPQGAVFALLASSSGDPPDLLADPGEWIWSSLITTDPAADAGFYKTLLGYDVVDLPDDTDKGHLLLASDNYARASVNPMPADRPGAHPRWLSFVRVDDAAAMAAKVTSLGGRVLLTPRPDRHGGSIAVVADPQGAAFGLLEWQDDAAAGGAK